MQCIFLDNRGGVYLCICVFVVVQTQCVLYHTVCVCVCVCVCVHHIVCTVQRVVLDRSGCEDNGGECEVEDGSSPQTLTSQSHPHAKICIQDLFKYIFF